MLKVIFSDLDGTLLKDSSIPSETFSIIEEIMDMNVKFGIVTGKSIDDYSKLDFVEELNGPVIVENGIVIANRKNDKIIPDKDWLNKISGGLGDLKEIAKVLDNDYKIYKKNLSFTININESPGILDDISKSNIQMKSVKARKNGDWMDFFPATAGKGNAIKYFCRKKDIDLKNVCAIGDDQNDIGMLKSVGLPCAVKNSPEELLEVVDKRNGILSKKESYLGGKEILKKILENYLS